MRTTLHPVYFDLTFYFIVLLLLWIRTDCFSSSHILFSVFPAAAELMSPVANSPPLFTDSGSIAISWNRVTAAQRYIVAFRWTDLPSEVPSVYMDTFPFEVTNAEIASTELAPGATYEILVWAVSITTAGGNTFMSQPLVLSITTADAGE